MGTTSTGGFPGYPQGTGVPGPGEFRGGPVDWTKTGAPGDNFDTFGCKVFNTEPNTPDWAAAKVYFERKVFTGGSLKFPDGKSVEYWGFEDKLKAAGQQPFPSPTIRLREGELAHVKMETRHGPHTIHHHGIEPTTMNDGVGHVSFETEGSYIYQWRPMSAGTWFYHCHRNTVLHFEMGLYGLLIVDPPEGWGVAYRGADRHKYDVEAFWVIDDIDPRWHSLSHSAGLCGEDVGLNIFQPKYFLVSGVHKSKTETDSKVAVKARKGQRVLIRALNASYSVVGIRLNNIPSECVSVDGHPIATPDRPWCQPYLFTAGEEILLSTAMRNDLWVDTSQLSPGTYTVDFKFYDWVTKKVHNAGQGIYEGSAKTTITIT
jgi:FtsP/CotA-like multicopper oxidase with cupredoxin domain